MIHIYFGYLYIPPYSTIGKSFSCWIFTGEGEEENDQKNLAYVAVTRAKRGLQVSDTIRKIIATSVNQITTHAFILRALFVLATFEFNESFTVGKLKELQRQQGNAMTREQGISILVRMRARSLPPRWRPKMKLCVLPGVFGQVKGWNLPHLSNFSADLIINELIQNLQN